MRGIEIKNWMVIISGLFCPSSASQRRDVLASWPRCVGPIRQLCPCYRKFSSAPSFPSFWSSSFAQGHAHPICPWKDIDKGEKVKNGEHEVKWSKVFRYNKFVDVEVFSATLLAVNSGARTNVMYLGVTLELLLFLDFDLDTEPFSAPSSPSTSIRDLFAAAGKKSHHDLASYLKLR